MAETKAEKAAKSKPKRKMPKSPATKTGSNGSSGNGASGIAGKATLPLIAGGAALAGVVGGAALGAKRSGSKVLGVPMPKPKRVQFRTQDLTKAAKQVGGFGEHVGDLASELRRAQEAVANGKANSPIEILLQGLTRRR